MYIGIILHLWIVQQFLIFANANDVLGCGGFIKSHVPLDFSKVEVKLVTKQGIVKDRTYCAPNNGYYFVPLYDKGELKLQISPPPGWSFTPKEVNLNVDGSDLCSQGKDIDFSFEGFGIAGKVESLGNLAGGPTDVTVKLSSSEGVRVTKTLKDGSFSFSPVFPGDYIVSISHPRWKIYKESVKVKVTEGNTDLAQNSLIIQGYDVSGKMLNADGSPVRNALIALFAQKEDQTNAVDGCEKTGVTGIAPKGLFLCFVTTNPSGEFVFPVVSSGSYYVAPYYKEENIYYEPDKIEFSVHHTSLQLSQSFQVVGFTIPGKVTNKRDEPISNAKIFLNGEIVATSDKLGKYKLEKLKIGKYRIKAEADNLLFDEVELNFDSNLQNLPTLYPSAFKVCGKVLSEKPEHVLFAQSESNKILQANINNNQEFCQYLSPGRYEVSVKVTEEDRKNGLQFFPLTQNIEVLYDNVKDLVFSQLKSSITGKIKCIQNIDCEDLSVTIKSSSEELTIPIKNSIYSANDIHPGTYEVTLSKNNLCWKYSKQTVNVNSEIVEIPLFIQTGYQLQFVSSHEAEINYKTLKEGKTVLVPLSKGVTSVCLEQPGQYTFTVTSCHEFDNESIVYSTSSRKNQITLNALKHRTTFLVQSSENHGPIEVNVQIENKNFKQDAVFKKNGYEIDLMLKPSEVAVVNLKSEKMFFSPSSIEIEGSSDCTQLGNLFIGSLGKVFRGQIQPSLTGVTITVENLNKPEVYNSQTNDQGFYKFPPLNNDYEYKISAQKDSYRFIGPDSKGNFVAQKLADITVEVLDEADKSALEGVLLSLSGGESFRRNLQTDSSGRITFHSLSAGDYFLRPMMKEYKFEPTSKIISIQEGESVKITLDGKRVAFSALGQLTTISGDPVENVNIVASGVGNCSGFSEEATTDPSGSFRIRGLQPFCTFKISVQVKSNELSLVERTSPESVEIKNIYDDVKDLHIIVFQPIPITDVLLKIQAEKVEHYRHLKVTVYRETTNPVVIYSAYLDNLDIKVEKSRNRGVLKHLPLLRLNNEEYSVHLEPCNNIKGNSQIEYFKANSSFIYIEMSFNLQADIREPPIKQTSIWTIIFILSFLLGAYNIQLILAMLKEQLNFNTDIFSSYIPIPKTSKLVSDYDNDIDQIVQDINNVKKHKPKKTN